MKAKKIVRFAIVGVLLVVGVCVVGAAALIAVLTVAEYRPADIEAAEIWYTRGSPQLSDASLPAPPPVLEKLSRGKPFSILSWNIGYASLDESQDFFMDGGTGVRPATGENVKRNLAGIGDFIAAADCGAVLLQEVDTASRRSYYVDQRALAQRFAGSSVFAGNFRCLFVPIPFPNFIGRVSSGLLTMNAFETSEAFRLKLPSPFTWPMRVANLKRCLLVSRMPLADSAAELVLVNLHLEAYDSSGGREAQTSELLQFLYREYAKGNFCIAGGDFNQNFPGIDPERFAAKNSDYFVAGRLDPVLLADGWRFVTDVNTPSARLLNEPFSGNFDETQLYVIDGFIISPNVELLSVKTADMGFKYSDHHPVKIEVQLQ